MYALPMIRLSGETLITTSLVIAEHFQKRHLHVLRDIKNLDCSEEFNQSNFGLVEYIDAKGEKRPAYQITKDGFMYLVMGYTGRQAAQWKERFITEFNRMAELLNRKRPQFGKRGGVIITRKLERQAFELFVAGLGGTQIAVALGVSPAAMSRVLLGKYQFSLQAGQPECMPELVAAVADRHREIEQERMLRERERIAQRYLNHNHNVQLAEALDRVGNELQAMPLLQEGGAA